MSGFGVVLQTIENGQPSRSGRRMSRVIAAGLEFVSQRERHLSVVATRTLESLFRVRDPKRMLAKRNIISTIEHGSIAFFDDVAIVVDRLASLRSSRTRPD